MDDTSTNGGYYKEAYAYIDCDFDVSSQTEVHFPIQFQRQYLNEHQFNLLKNNKNVKILKNGESSTFHKAVSCFMSKSKN